MELFEKTHKYLGVTIEMRHDFLIQARKSADQGLSFIGQIITVSGLIAGFGFTAAEHIRYEYFFAVGELLLFLNICVGLYFIKKFWYEEFDVFKSDIRMMALIAETLRVALEKRDESKAKEGIWKLEEFAQQERNVSNLFKLLPTIMIILILFAGFLIASSVIRI